MQTNADKFQKWAELAEGDERRQFVQLVEVARSIGVDPHRVVEAAVDLKKHAGGSLGDAILWLNGIPWFSIPLVAALEAKIKAEAIARIRAEAEAVSAEGN